MQTVRLSDVKPSPHPVRKTWDEDKMQELAASIAERGVIVPIKVRPTSDKFSDCRFHGLDWLEDNQIYEETGELCGRCEALRAAHGVYSEYELEDMEDDERDLLAAHEPFLEIVYGHRRAEAARRAGLVEIPAIVDGVDDTEALIEALIENVQREDMTQTDEAAAYVILRQEGLSLNDIAAQTGKNRDWISRLILLAESPTYSVWAGVDRDLQVDAGVKAQNIRGAIKDEAAQVLVTEKVINERLDRDSVRAVAQAYARAETPELKDAVLNTSGKLGDAERILQVAQTKVGVRGLAERDEHLKRQAFEEYDAAVKDFLDFMRLSERVVKTARDAAKFGKFSPEGARFAVGRIDRLIDELQALRDALD